jgi:hypothetical protein
MRNAASAPGASPANDGMLGGMSRYSETGHDEIAFTKSFTSPLFRAPPEEIVHPTVILEADLLADLVCDPTVLTTVESPSQVLREILFPMFRGTDQNKSKSLQILASFFAFLRERPLASYDAEMARRASSRRR